MKQFIITEEERSRILGMHQNATSRHYLNEGLKSEMLFDEIYDIINTSNSTEEFEERIKEIEPELEDLPEKTYNEYMTFINNIKDRWSFEDKEDRRKLKESERDLTRLVKRTIMEMESGSELEDLDNWIENNSEYISEYSLMEKLVELFNLNEDNVEIESTIENDSGGDMYNEDWGKKLLTIKNNGDDLFKMWLTMDNSYDFGKNMNEFDNRFYFNEYSL